MSNHFTGLSLGPPLGDQRLDLCDLYAFQSPADPARTVLILNANPNADALHPDAIYRLAVDNDGDFLNDLAITYVFAPPEAGGQTFDAYIATGVQARSPEPAGTKVVDGAAVSFGRTPNVVTVGEYTFFAGSRSDAFFFDYDGIKNLFDPRRQELHRTAPGRQVPVDARGLEPRGQRVLNGPRAAHERAWRQPRHPHLGAVQPAARRPAAARGPGRSSLGQQLLQHR